MASAFDVGRSSKQERDDFRRDQDTYATLGNGAHPFEFGQMTAKYGGTDQWGKYNWDDAEADNPKNAADAFTQYKNTGRFYDPMDKASRGIQKGVFDDAGAQNYISGRYNFNKPNPLAAPTINPAVAGPIAGTDMRNQAIQARNLSSTGMGIDESAPHAELGTPDAPTTFGQSVMAAPPPGTGGIKAPTTGVPNTLSAPSSTSNPISAPTSGSGPGTGTTPTLTSTLGAAPSSLGGLSNPKPTGLMPRPRPTRSFGSRLNSNRGIR
jgi:hypothetical protein